jgi:RNA recognition motif-containing protein
MRNSLHHFFVVAAAMLSMGYGFVEFETKKSAVNAIKKLQVSEQIYVQYIVQTLCNISNADINHCIFFTEL